MDSFFGTQGVAIPGAFYRLYGQTTVRQVKRIHDNPLQSNEFFSIFEVSSRF
jgi:hypothetical protein